MTDMASLLDALRPEMALFGATCVVMLLGLSRAEFVRKSCALVTAAGLLAAAWLGLRSPDAASSVTAFALFPSLLPFAKTTIALVALLLLPVLAGTVDRAYERAVDKGEKFDPIRATRGEFYAFFLFSVTGVMLCATANDLIWLFLALELVSLPTYVMVAMSSPRLRAQEAGVKYFFLGAFGAAIFLYGFALLYGATGATGLGEIREAFGAAVSRGENPMSGVALAGMVMAIIGVSFKIAAVPMHFYAPDVYQGAATPVSAYLAFAPKAAGFLALMSLLGTVGWGTYFGDPGAVFVGGSLPAELRVPVWVIAAMTMTVGNVLALLQSNVKRMLAYSSIAHSGYMLVGLIVGPGAPTPGARNVPLASDGLGAMLFYLLCYGVMNLGAFAAIAALQKRTASGQTVEVETLDDIRGLCWSRPLIGWSLVLSAMSLLGLPPLLGFFGKLWLFTSAISAGEILLVVVMGMNSAIAAFYYLRIAAAALLDQRDQLAYAPTLHPARGRRLAAALSALGVVALVPFVGPLQQWAHKASRPNEVHAMPIRVEQPKAAPAQAPH